MARIAAGATISSSFLKISFFTSRLFHRGFDDEVSLAEVVESFAGMNARKRLGRLRCRMLSAGHPFAQILLDAFHSSFENVRGGIIQEDVEVCQCGRLCDAGPHGP